MESEERGENDRVPRYSKPGPQLVTYYFQLIIGYLLLERRTLIVPMFMVIIGNV